MQYGRSLARLLVYQALTGTGDKGRMVLQTCDTKPALSRTTPRTGLKNTYCLRKFLAPREQHRYQSNLLREDYPWLNPNSQGHTYVEAPTPLQKYP